MLIGPLRAHQILFTLLVNFSIIDFLQLCSFRAMVYMLNCPDIMKRCQAEIDNVIGRNRAPSMKDKALMPYVEATVMEVLRMASTASFAVRFFYSISHLMHYRYRFFENSYTSTTFEFGQ